MSTPIIIFPSLSRAPTLDTSVKTNDDTIRDSMDLGYVATRPRFSRGRRTWNANIRNLTLEDVRALDVFQQQTVQRGALSFYYPNLVPNGSFEIPPVQPSEVVAGWGAVDASDITVQQASTSVDGLRSLQFSTAISSLGSGLSAVGQAIARKTFIAVPGEVYQASFQVSIALSGFSGVTYAAAADMTIILQMSDGSTVNVSPSTSNVFSAATSGFVAVSQQFTIPAPSGVLSIVAAQAMLSMTIHNSGTSAIALSASGGNSISVCFDSVGLALIQPAPGYSIYGRMVGSSALPFPVRFAASKLPEFSDLGFGDTSKLYGTTFALEEV